MKQIQKTKQDVVLLNEINNFSIVGALLLTSPVFGRGSGLEKWWIMSVGDQAYKFVQIGTVSHFDSLVYKSVQEAIQDSLNGANEFYLFDSEKELRKWLLEYLLFTA